MSVDVYPIDSMNCLSRPTEHSMGIGQKNDPQFTLSKTHHHAVVITPQVKEQFVNNVAAQISMFSSEELPASPSQSPDSERDWMTRVATSCLPTLQLLTNIGPSGWYGRTSPASYPVKEDEILPHYFEGWMNSGMGGRTECLTLSTSEWPKDAAVCSLSQTLEVGNVPQRFFLSDTACQGILRRAEKRGKTLPELLQRALTSVVTTQNT